MPDGDRFERLLRGRGWVKAYRLAAGNAEWALLVDSLVKAAAHALRNQAQSPSLLDVATVLCESLAFPSLRDSRSPSGGSQAFEHLCHGLDDIEALDRSYVGTQLAIRAAEKVFAEYSRQGGLAENEVILDRLGEVFVSHLIDHQCLSRVRSGIAEKNNRTVEQQASWEENLNEHLKPQARKLFQNALKTEDATAVRAPKSTATRPSLEVQLHEPLVPSGR
jgi:hypothetical protein